jgi:antitoxin (DNA-binding transcriptional repressor) of toxin-antitoxin stability system
MSRITATDAARSFSDILTRVAAGQEIEITRNGAPVAVIGPPRGRLLSAERFRELVVHGPRPDPEFAAEMRSLREATGPPGEPWPS